MTIGALSCGGVWASGVMVFTTGTGFVAPPAGCVSGSDRGSENVAPHMLQKIASSAFLLPQAEHVRMVEAPSDSAQTRNNGCSITLDDADRFAFFHDEA